MRSLAILAAAALSGCLGSPPDATSSPSGAADASPSAVELIPGGTPSTTETLGGSGGGDYSAFCPDDRFVTGLAGSSDAFGMTSVQAICSRFQVVDGGDVEPTDSIDGDEIVADDSDSVQLAPISCADGLVVVGFSGSENGNEVVSHLQFSCASLSWNGVAVVREPSEVTDVIGAPDDYALGSGACPAGMAAAGLSGRAGILIDAFQLQCFEVVARPAEQAGLTPGPRDRT